MGDIFGFVGTMLEPIRDFLCTYIGRQLGYLVHCKRNIKDFADEVDSLILEKRRIQIEVEAALNNAEVIHDDVREWQSKVQSMEDDKTRLLQGKQNLKCLDVRSRYRLGKEGKKKKLVVTKLIQDGNNFGTVGHQPTVTRAWQRTHTINYESFESRKVVFNDIMEALKDDAKYKIGIHGMPGVGKTRMMQEVAQQAENKRLFDEIAKIVVTQNPILKDIQLKLAASLNMKSDIETKDEDVRKELLRIRLKNGKKILVMVDDVWDDEIKLEDIGIPSVDDHTHGCKIILTSRIRDVCIRMGVQKNFEIGVLSELEAWDLFKKTVGDSTERPELPSVAEEVCSECHGLPLAIVTIGAVLRYEEGSHAWNDALHQLKHCKGNNIPGVTEKLYSCIALSYKYLKQKDLRSCFLHCCLFPEDAEISIDNLVTYGVATRFLEGTNRASMEIARNRTRHLVDTLKKSNLLLNGNDENFVKMHDVIRDVAISIASEEKDAMFLVKAGVDKWPDEDEYKHCKAISLRFKDDCVLFDDLECTQVCTLMLEFRKLSSKVPSTFFKWMEKLQVLHLRNMLITTLPSSLKNLRMLHLYNCKLVNVAFLGELRKLEILSIVDYYLEVLALEIGQLTRLRLLDLRECERLKILPSCVISSLSQLEELYIPDEFDQWKVKDNASLNELNSLKRLISLQVHVPNVELLPLNELLFKSLIRFQISIWSSILYSYEIRPSATKILKLEGFHLKRELNILMEKAEVLILEKLEGLKDVFHDREREGEGEGEGFLDLKYLKVEKCDGVEHLFGKPKLISQTTRPYASGSFSQLNVLKVDRCGSSYLFSSATARCLLQLQKLTITDCEMLEEIISEDQEDMDTVSFHGLKKMKLERLPNLRSFLYVNMKKTSTTRCNTSTLMEALFNHKVAFPALEKLEIYELGSLAAIWNDPLQSVLLQLQELTIRNCEMLEEIISDDQEVMMNTVSFHQLKEINLYGLPNLRSFYVNLKKTSTTRCNTSTLMQALFNHKVAFPALEELEIEELGSLTAIWDDQLQSLLVKEAEDSFRRLMYMKIFQCEKLVNVIPSDMLPRLQNLEKLEVDRCDSLLYEDEVLGTINVLPRLQESHLSNLTDLHLSNCNSLRNVFSPSTTRYLVHLQILRVENCEKMEVIVAVERGELGEEDVVHDDDIIVFPQLKHLKLRKLPNLTSFCCCNRGSIKQEEETMEHKNISRVEALFNHKVRFPALEELKIYKLKSLTAIWDNELFSSSKGEDSFRRLTSINVQKCHKLVNVFLPNALPLLEGLEILEVGECDSVVYGVDIVATQDGGDEIIVLSRLKTMRLEFLPNFKSFCCSRNSILLQQEALFNHKIRFPALEELNIYDLKSLTAIWDNELFSSSKGEDSFHRLRSITVEKCHKLNHIWITDSGGLLMFHNLTYLTVEKCNSLRYLFSLSIARRLTQLRELEIRSCDVMEEIVVKNEEQGEEEDSTNEIVFPKLWELRLVSLPKLTSFCGANNAAFKFPSLEEVVLHKCPELQTFASGGISTPPHITLYGDDWRQSHVSELNKYVEEQYIGEGKGVQTVDNEDEGTSS